MTMTRKKAAEELRVLVYKIHNALKEMQDLIKKVDPEEKEQSIWIRHIEDSILNLEGWINLMSKEQDRKIYTYKGEYGMLVIDLKTKRIIKDELDRKKIQHHTEENYLKRHNLYASIIEELLGEDLEKIFPPIYKNEKWHGKRTDRGFKAINDEIELHVDEEGTFIYDKEGWILSYSEYY